MYLEKNVNCHLVHHKSYTDSPGIERGLGDERPAPNALNHGTVHFGDRSQKSTILYSFPYILHSAFPRHLLEVREYRLETIPFVRAFRHFSLFIKEHLTTVVQGTLSLVRQSLASLTVCCRGIVKKKVRTESKKVLLECWIQRKYLLFTFNAHTLVISIQSDFTSAQTDFFLQAPQKAKLGISCSTEFLMLPTVSSGMNCPQNKAGL
jgi:hypothetical protein